MSNVTYQNEITALAVIDPYSDFSSYGGSLSDRLLRVAEANQCIPHIRICDGRLRQRNSVGGLQNLPVSRFRRHTTGRRRPYSAKVLTVMP